MSKSEYWHTFNKDFDQTSGNVAYDLFEMHNKFDFHSVKLTKNQLKGRLDFIQEELNEAYKALEENNADDFVDAHIDVVVVAVGTMDLARVNWWKSWGRVHSANMSKERGANNKRLNMEGMDLRKPENWTPPSHLDNVGLLPEIMMNDSSYKTKDQEHDETLNKVKEQRRYSVEFLHKCIEIMLKKADDYNSPLSPVKTIDYYPRGAWDLYHMIHIKYLRLYSMLWKIENGATVHNEDIIETLRDLAVFSAMFAEFWEGQMDGQNPLANKFGEQTSAKL